MREQKTSTLETTAGKTYIGKCKDTGYEVYQDNEALYWYELTDEVCRLKAMALLNEYEKEIK